MQFAIAAFLKPGAEAELIKYSGDFNEHIGQSGTNVLLAGALRDGDGKRVGYLALYEGETIADAQDWLRESPIYQADLYERLEVFEYQIEVGRLG
jgi:uncharacterized protein YciI